MSKTISSQYLITSKIGSGNFSSVFLAKNKKTQQIYAVKSLKFHTEIAQK